MTRPIDQPPRLAAFVLSCVLTAGDREYVLGDLAEEYGRLVAVRGEAVARRWYRGEVVRAVVPALRERLGRRRRQTPIDVAAGGVSIHGSGEERMGLSAMPGELKQAWRGVMRRPGSALIAILTLGLAIGSNAAMFGVVDAVLLRPLPYGGAERIVSVSEVHGERMGELGWASIPNWLDWREQSATLEHVSMFRGRSMALTGDGAPLYVYGAWVSASFFSTFGTTALRGRALGEGDDVAGADRVVALSHGLWQRRFGGAASVVGRTIVVDGQSRVVVGVMPQGFNAPGEWIGADVRMDLWVPFVIDAAETSRASRSYNVVGRLKQDETLATARAEMRLIADRLTAAWPQSNEGWEVRLLPWKELVAGYSRRLLLPLWGAMGLLLLVACANVGNLMLNRALSRQGEFATRAALGASGSRLALQSLVESIGIGLAAAGAGVLIAGALLAGVRRFDPGQLPRLSEATVDSRVLVVSALIGLAVGIVLALIPALRGARANVHDALRATARSGHAVAGARRLRDAMAVLQLALALALLAGSALVVRGFLGMRAISPGFEPQGVLVATVALSWDRVSDLEQRAAFTTDLLERLRATPGVQSAAMINSLPFSGSHQQQTFAIDGVPVDDRSPPFAALRGISPDYFTTMQIPLRGRDFDQSDLVRAFPAVIVNDAFAQRWLARQQPIGRRLIMMGGDVNAAIVGVVGNVRHYGLHRPAVPEIYFPYPADQLTSKSYIVRTDGDPAALANAVRAAIHDVDPAQPLRASGPDHAETVPLADMIHASLAGVRFYTLVLVLLAAIALALAAVGLFAVVAITVTEHRHEIGVRMALGAERRRVLAWILARCARLAAIAFVAGLLLLFAASRTLEALLFGASTRDAAALTFAIVVFTLITFIAIIAPASRVLHLQPARVLRQD